MIRGRFVARDFGVAAEPRMRVNVRLDDASPFVPVDFLVDTGADFTMLSAADASRVWPVRASDGAPRHTMQGVGGIASFTRRRAGLRFVDDEAGELVLPIMLLVALPTDAYMLPMPSLLGRDLPQAFALLVDPRAGVVGLTS